MAQEGRGVLVVMMSLWGCAPALPVRTPAAPGPACLEPRGAAARLAPDDAGSRHHPTVDRLDDGTVVVAWQIGKSDGRIAARAFDPDLLPRGPEVVLSGDARRATHPQVVSLGARAAVVWQEDDTGAIRVVEIDGGAQALGPTRTLLAPDGPRPGLYPDLTPGPDGELVALWYAGPAPHPGWHVAHGEAVALVEAGAPADKGGPGTVTTGPAGRPWRAWGEQDVGWIRRETALVVGPVDGPGATVAVDPARAERTALAFGADGRGVLAWTRYPWRDQGWSSRALFFRAGAPPDALPVAPAEGAATMIDAVAVGDVALLGWQQPASPATAVRVQPWDLTTGEPLCAPTPAHPPREGDQARANLVAWPNGDGGVSLIVVWHAAIERGRQTVAGRVFDLDVSRRRQSR